jgi:hypothetical protein
MGRKRRYVSNAERQAAYRARREGEVIPPAPVVPPVQVTITHATVPVEVLTEPEDRLRVHARLRRVRSRSEICIHRRRPDEFCSRCDS